MMFDHLRTGPLSLRVEEGLIRRVVGGELAPWSSEECNIDGIVQFAIAAFVPQLYPWAVPVCCLERDHRKACEQSRKLPNSVR